MSTADFEDAPRVALGGKSFAVPMLAAKQNRIIDPLILSMLPVFALWQTDKVSALAKITGSEYDKLQDICLHAIRRGNPEITKDQFLDLPITLPELVAAFPVIAEQTGIFKRGEPGEAQAGTAPQNSLTGTESSPTSAI